MDQTNTMAIEIAAALFWFSLLNSRSKWAWATPTLIRMPVW